jgi:hypothetical protein
MATAASAFSLIINSGLANAACPTPLVIKDGNGATQNLSTTDDAGGNCQNNVVVTSGTLILNGGSVTIVPNGTQSVAVQGTVPITGSVVNNGGSVTLVGTSAVNIGNNGSVTILSAPAVNIGSINGTVVPTGNLPAVINGGSVTIAGTAAVAGTVVNNGGSVAIAPSGNGTLTVVDSLHFGFVAGTSTELYAVATTTTTAAVTLLPAAVGLHSYLTSAICTRSDAGTLAVAVTIGGTVSPIIYMPNTGGGGGFTTQFNPPLVSSGTNAAITMTAGSATSTISCTGLGYSGTWLFDDLPEDALPQEENVGHMAWLDVNAGMVSV